MANKKIEIERKRRLVAGRVVTFGLRRRIRGVARRTDVKNYWRCSDPSVAVTFRLLMQQVAGLKHSKQ